MSALICAYCNQKGGVGKTTTCYHHIRAAILAGLRVLAIDLDPQGNLTSVTTADPVDPDQIGMADVLSARGGASLRDIIVPGIWEGLDVAPVTGKAALAAVSNELTISGPGRERRLKDALQDVAGEYDVILIDCAPSLDQLTINALSAADRAVIVTEASLFAIEGLDEILKTINLVSAYYNPTLTTSGIVVNRYDPASVEEAGRLRELKAAAEAREIPIIEPIMRKRVVTRQAMEAATGLDEYPTRGSKATAEIYQLHMTHILTEGAQR